MGYWQGDIYIGDEPQQPAGGYWQGDYYYAPPEPAPLPAADSWDYWGLGPGGRPATMGGPTQLTAVLAKNMGMSAADYGKWVQAYNARPGITATANASDPYSGNIARAFVTEHGGSADQANYYANQAQSAWGDYSAGQEALNDRWSGGTLAGQILKGIGFALLPAAVGPALAGTSALGAANFGGGLAGDVLSGTGLKALRTGLSAAGTGLNALSQGGNQGGSQGLISGATESPSLADSVLSQNTTAPSAPTSLSNSVMTTSAPQNVVRRPQIRLSPGFRRGQ